MTKKKKLHDLYLSTKTQYQTPLLLEARSPSTRQRHSYSRSTPSHESRDPNQPIANFRCVSVAPEETRFFALPPLKSLSLIISRQSSPNKNSFAIRWKSLLQKGFQAGNIDEIKHSRLGLGRKKKGTDLSRASEKEAGRGTMIPQIRVSNTRLAQAASGCAPTSMSYRSSTLSRRVCGTPLGWVANQPTAEERRNLIKENQSLLFPQKILQLAYKSVREAGSISKRFSDVFVAADSISNRARSSVADLKESEALRKTKQLKCNSDSDSEWNETRGGDF
ncbi:hypothetical protein WN51_10309 [Melipona quadrifasciata]|uniref:Uncharacterized protein n=1 Tax=Melipona quadrifasciata TaxID=166423 RepID=A0A0M9A744_9HYME|nr:hypothetical protein WN51_10309 [Melipona quadrifasciata]